MRQADEAEATPTGSVGASIANTLWVLTAAFVGILAAQVPLLVISLPAVITLLFGATFVAGFAWVRQSPRRFLASGSLYVLGTSALFLTAPGPLPDAYPPAIALALLPFALFAVCLVLARVTLGRVVKLFVATASTEERAGVLWRALSAGASFLLLLWAVMTWPEKLARYGITGTAGTAAFALNILGRQYPVDLWVIGVIDATMLVYAGALLMAFSLLDTLFSAWEAAKMGADAAGSGAPNEQGTVPPPPPEARNQPAESRDQQNDYRR